MELKVVYYYKWSVDIFGAESGKSYMGIVTLYGDETSKILHMMCSFIWRRNW
jgi:hypothetical protein